ncbi:hypothetical protein [Edaphovirga cremea]|uniref:hypothetical protein n=1 Tax=Edaphovirga cremea TaxID=2267246 RepID=UPI003988CCA9
MHDYTLLDIFIEWKSGVARIDLLDNDSLKVSININELIFSGVPRLHEWGESVSINNLIGPVLTPSGSMKLEIEMQSGDVIELIAKNIILPR